MDSLFSKMVKSGKITYFLDVKEAKNNTKYLTVTASQPSREEPKKFTKSSINVFSNAAEEFVGAVQSAKEELNSATAFSKTVKSGKMTYFVDVKEAKNSKKYVAVAATQPSKDDPTKFTRKRITVFDNAADDFVGALQEAITHLK
ncbi:MAG TPA: DUF3276 family protein [Bacteroidota bacterium]